MQPSAGIRGPGRAWRGLRWVDDRREVLDPEHPEVADRERAAREIGRGQPARPGLLDQRVRLSRYLPDTLLIGVLDDGHGQAALGGHRDPNVNPLLAQD